MKKTLLLLVFLTALTASQSQSVKRVLFIGNSYINTNNLPQIVAVLAQSAGDSLIFDSNTPGGYTFNLHSTNTSTISKIQMGNWDYVILQEQSQLPSFPITQVQTTCFPYARYLDSLINASNPCVETMFFMTWGRQNGDASNCPNWPPVCTYEGMDSLLFERYMTMTHDNNAVVAPVSAVWKYLRQNHPALNLYQGDGSHPSLTGSYAAACTFYATLFRKSPLLITNDYGLSTADAASIRNAVQIIVTDSLSKWMVGAYDATADFSYSNVGGTGYAFQNTGTFGSYYQWDFGDGNTSTLPNPVHTYGQAGNFSITLITGNCSSSDTIQKSLQVTATSLYENESKFFNLYPNPANNSLHIITNTSISGLTIYNPEGRIIEEKSNVDSENTNLDISKYAIGVYFIRLEYPSGSRTLKFSKH